MHVIFIYVQSMMSGGFSKVFLRVVFRTKVYKIDEYFQGRLLELCCKMFSMYQCYNRDGAG